MAKHKHTPLLLLILLLTLLHVSHSSSPHSSLTTLLTFKQTLNPTPPLLSNWNSTTPLCSFHGITCLSTSPPRISKLILENLTLTGPFPSPLLSLPSLRVLSLKHNSLSGPLPSTLSSPTLKLLYLSYNTFSGPLPSSLSSLPLLFRLDLSHNNLSGPLPLSSLSRLLTLSLNNNHLSGPLGNLRLPSLQDLDLSHNHFSGPIPPSLSSFPATSFSNNPSLCGPPLLSPCKSSQTNPVKPGNDTDISSKPTTVISSTPTDVPGPKKAQAQSKPHSKMSTWVILAIIVGDVLVLLVITVLLYFCLWRKGKEGNKGKSTGVISESEKVVYSRSPYNRGGGNSMGTMSGGKMVFLEGERRFELEDLLRASAEMLGKGVYGTAYKAVLDDGAVVAVKRLKEVGGSNNKKEFEELMEVLGRLRHPNVVPLKAYYFAPDEKLLVFDFLVNGSLFWLLHGNRGPGRTPLDWTTRLKIAAGAARGVAFIHDSCRALKLIHGNIKSTNILIDKAGNACVTDFGLSSFAPTSSNNSRLNGYRSPESLDGRKLTQKSDVYSFGVLLLELLTGKYPSVVDGSGPYGTEGVGGVVDLPRWVQSIVREEWTAEVFDLELMRYKDIEEEMVGLLQIAMACTSASPDQRPRMGQVVKMIEEIRGVEVSPSHENFDSDSPCVSEETGGVSQ